jgi:hypothetical protein
VTKGKPTGRYFESVDESRFFPGRQFEASKIESRKQKFDQINRFITARGGWVVSVPRDSEVRFETLPGSKLVRDVQDQFPEYEIFPDGTGEKILPAGITETYLTEGSTVPQVRHHAGITRVLRFAFDL